MKEYRTYKYLIIPNEQQIANFRKTFLCVGKIHNLYIENDEASKKKILAKDILSRYKAMYPEFNEVDSSALINKLFQLQENKNDLQEININRTRSFTISNLYSNRGIYFVDDECIHLSTFGNVQIKVSRKIPIGAHIHKATIKEDGVDRFYVCIGFAFDSKIIKKEINLENSIGLDYSSTQFYCDSDGNRLNMPHFYQISEERIGKLNMYLSKCEYKSKNYNKILKKLLKIYNKIENQRNDYLHKESTRLANKYDVICVENLNLEKIAQYGKLGKRTYDNGYGRFLFYLDYKMRDRGKILIKVKRNFPSTKMCSNCGEINRKITINDRAWKCPKCGVVHDRDQNAAINIRNEGLKML